MKPIRSFVLLISCVFASCVPAPFPSDGQKADLVSGSSHLAQKRAAWLKEAPRKNTEMDVPRKELPKGLKDMGFAEATVSENYVILPKEGNLREGVLVFTGQVAPIPYLRDLGVEVSDTAYPEIKTLKMRSRTAR
ncbi:hypothetical protein JIN84_18740 [Luteolibacter yonseiensis]|uniref:Uncharacterized protein n=1 Tax=Luteolibacter yonseiensis TaxID=1144680 RepID=A0A934R650_9BACT|nr:hypothetical protein [Luteolibacter yonseiensis]MBK1817664.1 hypothetical protein [Luteolibacter yonseiensis]